MAMSASALATLRRYIAEATEANYTDVILEELFLENGEDLNVTAADVWRDKAARAAALVDVSEGASTRKMSQVYTQAAKQAEFYGGSTTVAATTRSATTRAIER